MNIVFFCHPSFMRSQSMPRFARMIGEAMRGKGHEVHYWSPKPIMQPRFAGTRLEKWAGYVDQYALFPAWVKSQLPRMPDETLFVFCDQALGPWVPLVKHRPHVIHAHDLLALKSALDLVPQNPTSRTGKVYQRYIRSGFRQGQHFISVSKRTERELKEFGGVSPSSSTVVYNGLNYPYHRDQSQQAYEVLIEAGLPARAEGMLLHVGGDQWYKNTAGIIRMYAAYAKQVAQPLPLWMVSPPPKRADVLSALETVPSHAQVLFFQGLDNRVLQAAYSLAKVFLFPSHAEGFGWPIIEAQMCGCPVITTDDAPMNEIGGPNAVYVPRVDGQDLNVWAQGAAEQLMSLLDSEVASSADSIQARITWASRFTQSHAIDGYETVYQQVVNRSPAIAA